MRAETWGRPPRAAALVLAAAALAACGGAAGEPDGGASADARPGAPDARRGDTADGGAAPLRLMSFNIKHGAVSSLEEVADVIRAEAPDIVALQEVDLDRARSGNVIQHERLGQLTGMASSFRDALQFDGDGQYGLAVLSRHPILGSDRLSLTSTGEQRILAVWQIELPDGRVVQAGNTHLATIAGDREVQIGEVVADLTGRELALVMGDFNEAPGGPVHQAATAELHDAWADAGEGDGFTMPATEPTARIDYVFLGADWPAASSARVVDSEASDHRPVVVEVPLP
ncbi:MAG TPA: endonuclease/exonuclease/phosphatase family protein [Kofleriaceae bacterium]|nr:endonuclease/exonuclease/phosphatase family protein [Kofleriaceae bacterium]